MTTKRRSRVCIVRQQDLYELPVRREAEALARAGYDVDVILMRHPSRPRRAIVGGVTVTSLPASMRRSAKLLYLADYAWFFLLTAIVLAIRHVRRPYAVVQVNTMPDFLVFAAIVPKLLGARVVAFMKEPVPELAETVFGRNPLLRRVLTRIEQQAMRFADHSVTVTEPLKRRYVERGAQPERISVVLNGVSPDILLNGSARPAPTEHGAFTLMCHSTIEDRYGQDTIVDALALLRHEIPDLHLVLTGRGSGVRGVTHRVERYGLEDVVRYEGFVSPDRLAELLHSADVGIVAQKSSGYSNLVHTNKMMDFWIAGMAVIASRLEATVELYDDSVLEYFEPGDPADLARAIRRLYRDPARRAELQRNGREALARHGWDVQRRVYLGVYEELLAR